MKIGLVTRNVIANMFGNVWAGLMGLAFIPLYVRFMGIESYGLVGFFLTLQAVFALMDFGLNTTTTREFARLTGKEDAQPQMRNLLRSLEVIYWTIGIVNGAVVIALSKVIATRWVNADALPPEAVEYAVKAMGLTLAAQWPTSLYNGALIGQQRQVLLNGFTAGMATARGLGSVLVLWLISPTVTAYFLWQAVVSLVMTVVLAIAVWRRIGGGRSRAMFDRGLIHSLHRFAAGVFGISALGVLVSQLDKLILSKQISLHAFGYYSVAAAVSGSLFRVTSPVLIALFPRFSQLVAEDEQKLPELYHRACQSLAAFTLPIAAFIAFFAPELLRLWTHSEETARVAAPILVLLIAGTGIGGLLHLPYAIQLAYGWTRLTFTANAIAVVILAPSLYFAAQQYGAVGAAAVWCSYNVAYAVLVIGFMHRRYLKGEQWRWYGRDVGLPIAVAVSAGALMRALVRDSASTPRMIIQLVAAGLFMQLVTTMALPEVRRMIVGVVKSLLFTRERRSVELADASPVSEIRRSSYRRDV